MNSFQYKMRRFLFQEFIPVTKATVVLSAFVSLFHYLLLLVNLNLGNWVALVSPNLGTAPWTLITYPLFNPDLLSLILEALWLWFVGGSLERSWGSKKYAVFLLTAAGATGLLMAATEQFLVNGAVVPISGLLLPLVAVTWAWSVLYPGQEMLLFGIIPIQARWTAWITAVLAVYPYLFLSASSHTNEWLVGIAALSGIPIAYLFIYDRFSGRKGSRRRNSGLTAKNRFESSNGKSNRKKFRIIK